MLEIRHPPYMPGHTVQVVNFQTGAVSTGSTGIPLDDTIPQNNEGDEVMSLAITPKRATNKLKIDVKIYATNTSGSVSMGLALFKNAVANALAFMAGCGMTDGNSPNVVPLSHFMTAGTINPITFKVRIGKLGGAGTTTFNGGNSARLFGGVLVSSITITEIQV